MFSLTVITAQINYFYPDLLINIQEKLLNSNNVDKNFISFDLEYYLKLLNISFDYAIMEKTNCAYCVPLLSDWDDLGSWYSVYKNIKKKLSLEKSKKTDQNKKVNRPWGYYEVVSSGENFLVKHLIVLPNKSLSLQKHQFRSEHWVVVSGTANVINGDQELILEKNQSTYIPINTLHRLSNKSNSEDLIIVEVQCGAYISEDDITRFADEYGRETKIDV